MKVWVKGLNALTGGAAGALDAINGNLLTNGDVAIVRAGGRSYLYELDHDNASAEASPWIVQPDKNYGTKRWVLQPADYSNATLARAYLSANQTGIADGVGTLIALDSESFDLGANFAANKYTFPVTGYYQANFSVSGFGVGGNIETFFAYLADGSSTEIFRGSRFYGASAGTIGSSGSHLIYGVAGGQAQLMVYSNVSAGNTTVESGAVTTGLSIYLVSKG